MTSEQERFDRLPKWAQEQIASLRRQAAEDAKHIAHLSEGDPHSDTFVHGWNVRDDIPLGVRPNIRFQFGPERNMRDEMTASLIRRNGVLALEIQGGDRIVVKPVSSNLIRVEIDG